MFSKTLKIFVVALIFISSTTVVSQNKKVSQFWTSFTQSIDVKTDKKTKFKIQASVKVDAGGKDGVASIWTRVDNTNGEAGFLTI